MDKIRDERPPAAAAAPFTDVPGWRGLRPPLLSDDVFVAALSTQVLGPLDFDVVANLSQAYGAVRQCRSMHDRLMTDIYEGRVKDIASFRGRTRDLVGTSSAVTRTVTSMIATLDARRTPAR
jgi:hypothetical protein